MRRVDLGVAVALRVGVGRRLCGPSTTSDRLLACLMLAPFFRPLLLRVLGAVLLEMAELFVDVALYSVEITRLHSCPAPLALQLVLAAGETIRESDVIFISSRLNVRSR